MAADFNSDVSTSPFKFPWSATKKILDSGEGSHTTHHFKYKDLSGVSRTLGAQAERVKAGTSTEKKCETFSYVYSPRSGTGYTTITQQRPGTDLSEPIVIKWGPKDVFAVPSWSEIVHTADEGEDAYLFAFNDRPQMESLGLNRILLKDGEIGMATQA
jgi:gentisate 1,2-dioxygenase